MKPISAMKILSILIILMSFVNFSFSKIESYRELKKAFEDRDFNRVIRIYKLMQKQDMDYIDNEKDILLMTASSICEVITVVSEIEPSRKSLIDIFTKLLYRDHEIRGYELRSLEPQRYSNIFHDAFDDTFNGLFGKLTLYINIEGVEIFINGNYVYKSIRNDDVFEKFLWTGKDKKKYSISLNYDRNVFERFKPIDITIKPSEKITRDIMLRKIHVTQKDNYIVLSVDQSLIKLEEIFNENNVKFVQPFKDLTGFEFGIGFGRRYYGAIQYKKGFNFLNPENRWEGKGENYLDYDISEITVSFSISIVQTRYFAKPIGVRLGYKNLTLQVIDFRDDTLDSNFSLFFGGIFFTYRSKKRNDVFAHFNIDVLFGDANLEYIDLYAGKDTLAMNSFGLSLLGEIGYSWNKQIEFSLGANYEYISSAKTQEKSNYFWQPDKIEDSIKLLRFFAKIAIRL